ncbi:multiubiquitin domain-containing protein [Streptomyces sp. NPDC088935]|uniref:multiubiquitin domain-containing protein n=1 Tax=Streptomyces sp. NPDC088935 TaxID=3365916 RepID=UPI0037FC3549
MTTPDEATAQAAPHRPRTVTVTVNGQPVVLPEREVTGREIKQVAMAQGLPIDEGFQLSVRRSNGRYEVVDDSEEIHVHARQEFLAVPPDDNS